jgi:hypothetical protein
MVVEKMKYETTKQKGVHSQISAELRADAIVSLVRRDDRAELAGTLSRTGFSESPCMMMEWREAEGQKP